ncbi:Hypothetical protein KK9_0500 [Borreliella garinii BgVir]|nr:Hypothetical protein KK9_0500 [Borreliella garinii BgVir]
MSFTLNKKDVEDKYESL